MSFNISTKKILSASNIKKIIALGISLRDEMEALEKSIIAEYDETKTYSKGDCFFYNGYLYRTKYTTTGVFDESKAEKIGDNLELIEKSDIEAMLGLTTDELQTLSSIILDSEVRLDKTWSSSKIYTDLQQCLSDSKAFTLQQFAKASKASYHVVSATSEMIDKSVIYLMPNSTNYDMYIVESDGTPTKIGDTTIDLSQYAKLSDLNNYYDKATSDGKYATITTVDGKVDKTSILSTISSTPSDDKLLSEKAINDTLVKKTDITTTIDISSTDTQVPSAKSVYDNVIKDNNIKTYTSLDQLGLTAGSETLQDIAKAMVDGSIAIIPIINGVNQSLYPATFGNLIVYRGNNNRIDFMFYPTTDHVMSSKSKYGLVYVCSYHITKDLLFGWQRICTTSVNNVPTTKITLDSKIFSDGDVYYEVKNGVCYVFIRGLIPTKAGISLLVSDSMPKSNYYILQTLSLGNTDTLPTTPITARILEGSTELVIHSNNNTKALYGSFSYPVAES